MKVLAIVQARLKSTRLPKKVLAEVNGRSMIHHVMVRATRIIGVDETVLNVPIQDRPDFLSEWDSKAVAGVPLQEVDVLASFRKIARERKADVIVRLTGDCPLLDPNLGTDVLRLYLSLNDELAYCANDTLRSGYPDGTDVEVFSMKALHLASDNANQKAEREHVTLWMRRRMPGYGIFAPYDVDLRRKKWSVDTAEDLDHVRAIYEHLQPEHFGWEHTLAAERKAESDA